MALHKDYLGTASLALFSKGFNILSTFGILWFLNAFMGKEAFGLFMVAFALMFALSMMISSGFQALILYHVSRDHERKEARTACAAGQLFWLSTLCGCAVAALIYGAAPFLSELMGQAGLEPWLRNMALFVPVNTAAIVLPGYSRARQRVKETLFFQEIFLNFLRVSFVALIWFTGAEHEWVCAAYIGSALIPVLILFARAPIWPRFGQKILGAWDVSYGFKIMVFQILNQPFRGFDIVLVGAFSSPEIVADYTMAVRLAQMLWIPKHAAAQLQVPRMGALLKEKKKPQLEMEFNAMRSFSLIAVLIACAGLLFLGGPVLSLFGAYESALPALYILAAASIIRTGFGASGDLIGMAGHAGASAFVASLSMIITVAASIVLVPLYGAAGGALAVLFGTLQMFVGFTFVLKRTENLNLMNIFMWIANSSGVIILIVAAYAYQSIFICGLLMAALSLIVIILDKSWLKLIKHVP